VQNVQPLASLLAILRMGPFIHQTHHWQTRGKSYYADHLLFERLYNESQTFIDQVAERTVGLGDESLVCPVRQVLLISKLIPMFTSGGSLRPDEMVEISLRVESFIVSVIDKTMKALEASGSLTHGTSNLLEGAADLHETFVYLLQQRTKVAPDYARP
jgi:DNA-binding ferritin-like protein